MLIDVSADSIQVADFQRPNLERLGDLNQPSVSLIGDCFSRMGIMDPGIRPMTSVKRLAGSILPVLSREGDNLAIHRALELAQPGDILVINAMGELSRAVFGSIMGEACIALGVGGVVVDGSIRDVEELDAMGLPVFARGISPAGPYKTGPGSVGFPVACGRLVCPAGHVLIGDSDGITVLSPAQLELLPNLLARQSQVEEGMRSKLPTLATDAAAYGSSLAVAGSGVGH